MADLRTTLCGRELDSPFVLGSGPCGWDAEALAACANAGCGAVVTKSITIQGAVNTTRHMISNGSMSLLNNEGGSDTGTDSAGNGLCGGERRRQSGGCDGFAAHRR